MPAKAPPASGAAADQLQRIGERIRARRKDLRVSATAAAEGAGLSRVTLHRIEHGEPSVAAGAYFNALDVLGLDLAVVPRDSQQRRSAAPGWIPVRIHVPDYPQLKRLAWQVHGTEDLTPQEALDIYERNARHIDRPAMTPAERDLLESLRVAFARQPRDV